ncbi:MAG: hypothetical protein ACXV8Q_18060 [Methylobacter sp.]
MAGLSIADVTINYHGSNDQTRLGSAINGIMEPNLKYKNDKEVILKWIQDGADEPDYDQKIAPILNHDCITCHTPAINPSLPDLTHYAGVSEVARIIPAFNQGFSYPFIRHCVYFVFYRQDFPALRY